MRFLVPAALGLASLAGPLIVLYMLRSKRRPERVPSTMLWQEIGEPVSSAVPWRPLKLTWLLVLQLVVLALFVLSLARPFIAEATVLGPHTVFVIDTSGSMAMAGRFEQAQAAALDLAEDVSEANLASVVEAGPHPSVRIAFSSDPEAVAEAIRSLRPGGGAEDLSTALRLARGLAAPDRETSVVIFSDGGAAPLPEEPVVGATHLVFDDHASNLAISGFDAEPSTEGTIRVFVQVENHGADRRTVEVAIDIDGLPAGSTEITVDGLSAAQRVLPVPATPGSVVTARLVGADDALALDDRADLVVGGGADRGVAVVGAGSPFLTALLQSTPGVSIADADEADLLIVDGGPLPEIDRPTWLIRTETTPEGIDLVGLERNLAVTFARPGDPVLDGVDLSETVVAEAQHTETLTWLPLVSSGETPLVLLGEVNGHRVVYTTFDLTHSNLPVQVAFPILGANLLQWLGGGDAVSVSTEPAGTPIALLTPVGHRARVTLPSGDTQDVAPDAATFFDTDEPGVYRIDYVDAEGDVTSSDVAVRRFVPSESSGPSREIVGAPAPGASADEGFLVREWSPWIVAAALALMALEWWVGHQRPRFRRREVTA
ncbi:MAG: BatA and WFA domain-containing protein [Acidimicrobiia bacterium]